jgi:transposase
MHTTDQPKTAEVKVELPAALREIQRLQTENRILRQQLALERYRQFAPKSEKTPREQEAGLFNEAEATADPAVPEPAAQAPTRKADVPSHGRRKPRGPRTIDLSRVAHEQIIYTLPEEELVCPECSGHLHEMGEETRQEIKVIPAHIVLVKHVRKKYACRHCQEHAISTPVLIALMPTPAFPGSLASPSAVAHIIGQKFLEAMPLYRQEKAWARSGIELSRQTLANWVIKGADWLQPIYDKMRGRLVQSEIVKADETPVQVLHEDGRKAQTKSYMWLYRSGRDGPPIVVFEYQCTRSGEHPKEFLKNFRGYLQTDGYSGYSSLPDVKSVGCWAHARRKFDEALSVLSNAERKKGATIAHVGLDYCNRLFAIERDLHEATPEVRKSARLERSKPLLDEFHIWLMTRSGDVLPKSPIGTAVSYPLNQWERLVRYLEDGRLDIDNNSSERAIKPFVVGRKNWMFANTPDGAKASQVLYSVIETAKENGLNPTAYLQYLLEQLPAMTVSPTSLDPLLPWSPSLPSSLRAPGGAPK